MISFICDRINKQNGGGYMQTAKSRSAEEFELVSPDILTKKWN